MEGSRRFVLNTNGIQIVMFFVTVCSFFTSLIDSIEPMYRFSFVQPLAFGVGLMAYQKYWKYAFAKISGAIILSTYFVRMSVLPLLAILGNHASIIPGSSLDMESYAIANFLSAYEFLIISLFLMSKAKNSSGTLYNNYAVRATYDGMLYGKQRVPFLLKIMIVVMITYMIYIFMSDPTVIRQNFSLLVGTPDDWYVRTGYRSIEDAGGSGVLGVLVTLTIYVFWYIQAILPPALLVHIREWKITGVVRTLSVFVIAALLFMLTSGTKIHSLECGFSFLILVYLCYGERYTQLIKRIAVIGGVAAVLGVMAKSGMDGYGFENLHKVISSYFGGVQNIAASIYTVDNYSGFGIGNIIPDIVNQIPIFGNRLSEMLHLGNTTNYLFNHSLTGGTSLGQIIPALGQGYSYFGFVLSPIVPLVAAKLADHFDYNAMKSEDLILKNVYLIAAIMMSRAVVTTNMMSAIAYIFNTYISLLIVRIGYLTKRIK